ncbi:MAG: hypothetical protein V3S19_05190, partial [Gemmatimonadales bacterium]
MAGPRTYILRAIVVGWAIGSLAAVAAALAVCEIDRAASLEASRANIAALWPFWVASISSWASLTAVWLELGRTPPAADGRPFLVAGAILAVAAAARVAVILTHQPALSDDVYRYVLDGRNTAGGINPYLLTPAEQEHHRELVALVNNPTMHTVYLPTSQWVFGATALATPRGAEAQASARVFRAVMVGFELAAISLVLLALSASGRSCWWAALYAWHPLPLAEIAGSGHQEGLGIFLLVAAIVLGTAVASSGRWLHTTRWSVCVALGVLVKPMFLPVAAFLLKGRRWHAWVTSLVIGAAVSAAVGAPLLLSHDGRPLENLSASAKRFTNKWAHFGSVYEPLLWTTEKLTPGWTNDPQEVLTRRICLAAVAVIFVWVWLRPRAGAVWSRSRAMFLAMVLLSPAAHPWYLLWALVLVPMAPAAGVWVASLTVLFGYAAFGGEAGWSVPRWVMVAAYVPVYVAVAVDLIRRRGT